MIMKSWIPYAISVGICALSVPIFIWLIKSKFKRKTLYLIITGLAVCVICEILISNVSFPITSDKYYASPDEIYYQTNLETKIQAVVEGEKSALVFADNHGNYYAKTDKGYQFSPNGSTKEVYAGSVYYGMVTIFRYLDSNDYYVTVTVTESLLDGKDADVADNKNSKFQQTMIYNYNSDNTVYAFLTCVHNIDNYAVTICGNEYKINLN